MSGWVSDAYWSSGIPSLRTNGSPRRETPSRTLPGAESTLLYSRYNLSKTSVAPNLRSKGILNYREHWGICFEGSRVSLHGSKVLVPGVPSGFVPQDSPLKSKVGRMVNVSIDIEQWYCKNENSPTMLFCRSVYGFQFKSTCQCSSHLNVIKSVFNFWSWSYVDNYRLLFPKICLSLLQSDTLWGWRTGRKGGRVGIRDLFSYVSF